MKQDFNTKKIIVTILAIVILFIPTYIAIANYNSHKDAVIVTGDTVTTLSLQTPDGKTYSYTQEGDEDGMYTLFTSMRKNSTEVSAVPDSLLGEAFVLATLTQTADDSINQFSFKFYFSTNPAECYMLDSEGKASRLTVEDANSFLATSCAIYLYKTAQPPVMTVSDGTVILPESLTWNYLSAGNVFQPYTESNTDIISLSYSVGSDLGISFSAVPSVCILKAYNGTDLMFEGAYDNLSQINLKRSTSLTFVLEAEWYRTEGCEAYGTATYRFKADFSAPAEFKINETEINCGSFAVISGINVADPSKIVFSSEPALLYTPVFYAEGDYVHALIPVSYGSEKGTYKLKVEYGISSAEFTLNVTDYRYGYKNSNYKISANMINTLYTDANIASYNELFTKICSTSETYKYFSGTFIDYQQKNTLQTTKSTITLGFGRNVLLTNATGKSYEHTGVDFEVAAGNSVPAMQSGKIAYAGSNEILGMFVVIDHGMGLKSWYAHLGEISVKAGDIVTPGQTIGKTGKTGFIEDNRLHIGITVGNIPIAPYALWEKGVTFATFD